MTMLNLLLGLLGSILAKELGEWAPNLADKILVHTARRAPPPYDERLLEEWRALLADTPGDLGKLLRAISLYWCRGDLLGQCKDDAASRPESNIEGIRLSVRETSILDLVAKGKTNKDIAQALSITAEDVRLHLAYIMVKFDTTSDTLLRYMELSTYNQIPRTTTFFAHPQSTLRRFIRFLMKHGY